MSIIRIVLFTIAGYLMAGWMVFVEHVPVLGIRHAWVIGLGLVVGVAVEMLVQNLKHQLSRMPDLSNEKWNRVTLLIFPYLMYGMFLLFLFMFSPWLFILRL